MGHIGAKISANNGMPSRVVFLVEFFFYECSNVLLNVVLFHCLCSTINSVLLHVLRHVSIFDHSLSVRHCGLIRVPHCTRFGGNAEARWLKPLHILMARTATAKHHQLQIVLTSLNLALLQELNRLIQNQERREPCQHFDWSIPCDGDPVALEHCIYTNVSYFNRIEVQCFTNCAAHWGFGGSGVFPRFDSTHIAKRDCAANHHFCLPPCMVTCPVPANGPFHIWRKVYRTADHATLTTSEVT
mmetsp:Transcript_89437/g.177798  ORF Transcript_89437/g.177798 Transcript_89437/m.177798 type:complete len:243 (-) Transcript_89437:144-872(-)